MFRFSAVRTTHAAGAGCLLDGAPGGAGPGEGLGDKLLRAVLVTDDDQDRAQAVVPGTPVELREVQALGSHAYSTRNRRSRDYSARPGNPGTGRKLTRKRSLPASLSRTVQAGPDQDDLTDVEATLTCGAGSRRRPVSLSAADSGSRRSW